MKRLTLGVLANEFFDPELGRMGGFGWAARQIARCFADPGLGVDVVYLTGELRARPGRQEVVVHGTRLILRQRSRLRDILRVRAEKPDLLLVMDYRPNYRLVCWALPQTPMIVWVRDPRPPDDVAKVNTLSIPGQNGTCPKGILQPDCSSLGSIARASRWLGRPLLFASPAPHLREKLSRMIGKEVGEFFFLPNPIDLEPGDVRKSERPLVASLARLDPYKRPWLLAELARRFPQVDFVAAGRAHYQGPGSWEPESVTRNLRLAGQLGDCAKTSLLSSAWVLVNTSIHEGLAVSLLEGLACETPLLACVDPGSVVSRFGIFTGRFDGSGLDALPSLSAGLERLLSDAELRRRLGKEGRRWVEATHTRRRFIEAFSDLCGRAGVLR